MSCSCGDDVRRYLIAESRDVTGPSTRWEPLLNVRSECGARHLTMRSIDSTVRWRVTTIIDKVPFVNSYRTAPTIDQYCVIPPEGAFVEYYVESVESLHVDPFDGPGGVARPSVQAFASDAASQLESPSLAYSANGGGEVESPLVYCSALQTRNTSGANTLEMLDDVTGVSVPEGDYLVREMGVSAHAVSGDIVRATFMVSRLYGTANWASFVQTTNYDFGGSLGSMFHGRLSPAGFVRVNGDGLWGQMVLELGPEHGGETVSLRSWATLEKVG